MPATATKPKATEIPPTQEPNAARHVRETIVEAIEAGRELTAAQVATINRLFVGNQVAAVSAVAKRFAEDVALGKRLEEFRPLLQRLLDGGAAGAIFDVAQHRYALQTEFEKTPYYKRKLELFKQRDERLAELTAAEADEDSTRAKTARLRECYTTASQLLNTHLNSQDPTLVAFRRAMTPTGVPQWNDLDWRLFAI